MTYRESNLREDQGIVADIMVTDRGQGLNNAVHDAAHLGSALKEVCQAGKSLVEAIDVYEKEVVERGHDAVISSGQNSMMITDWNQLKESPIFQSGMKQDKKQ